MRRRRRGGPHPAAGRSGRARASTTTSLAARPPGPDRLRRHPVRADRTLGRLPGRRPRAHGPGRVDGRLRLRPGRRHYDTPPLACLGDQAWRTAATYGAIAVLAALAHRDRTGEGQFIDVSAHECSASMTEWHLMTYLCSGEVHGRGSAPDPDRGRRSAGGRPHARLPRVRTCSSTSGPCSSPTGWPVRWPSPSFADPRHRARNYGEMMAGHSPGWPPTTTARSFPAGPVGRSALGGDPLARRGLRGPPPRGPGPLRVEHRRRGPYAGAPFVAGGSPSGSTGRRPSSGSTRPRSGRARGRGEEPWSPPAPGPRRA